MQNTIRQLSKIRATKRPSRIKNEHNQLFEFLPWTLENQIQNNANGFIYDSQSLIFPQKTIIHFIVNVIDTAVSQKQRPTFLLEE